MQRCSTKTKIKTEKSHFASYSAHMCSSLTQQTLTPSTVWGAGVAPSRPSVLRLEMCGVVMVTAVDKGYPWWNLFGLVTPTQSWDNRLCKWLLLCK